MDFETSNRVYVVCPCYEGYGTIQHSQRGALGSAGYIVAVDQPDKNRSELDVYHATVWCHTEDLTLAHGKHAEPFTPQVNEQEEESYREMLS